MKRILLSTLLVLICNIVLNAQVDVVNGNLNGSSGNVLQEKVENSTVTVVEQPEVADVNTPKWALAAELGYGFLDDAGSLKMTVGASYFVYKDLYIQARMGYNSYLYHKYETGSSFDVELGFITLPLEIGYRVVTNNKRWGIVPFAGIGVNIGVSAKVEYGDTEYKAEGVKGKIGAEARVGLRLVLGGFLVTGSCYFPLNSKQEEFFGEDAYPEVSIGYAF